METYTNIMKYNSNFFEWFKSLPIKEEEEFQVIILPLEKNKTVEKNKNLSMLAGSVINYSDPFNSVVSPEEWEVLK